MSNNLQNKRSTNLLVIGNGFDMFLGLDSSFKEFFGLNDSDGTYHNLYNDINKMLYYMENNFDNFAGLPWGEKDFNPRDYPLDFTLVIKYIDIKRIRRLINNEGRGLRYENVSLSQSDIDDLKDHMDTFYNSTILGGKHTNPLFNKGAVNFWASYFILRKEDKDYDWSSIENEIYKLLIHKNFDFNILAEFLYYAINNRQHRFNNYKYLVKVGLLTKDQLNKFYRLYPNSYYIEDLMKYYYNVNKDGINFNSIFEHIYLLVFIFLQRHYDDLYNIFSHHNTSNKDIRERYPTIFHFLRYRNRAINNNNIKINFQQICLLLYNFLRNQLSKLEYDLNKYLLNKCANKYNHIYGISYGNVSKELLYYMSNYTPFSLINFNYTKPIYNNYNIHKKNISHNNVLMKYNRNIHGVLINPKIYNSKYSPVIGVSDVNINMDGPTYKFTKNYRIMRLSCNNYDNVFDVSRNIKEIKFFGQSFDPADYSYFFDIFDNYKIYKSTSDVKLVFYYVTYNGLSDDYCAVKQINRINLLLSNYCRYRKINMTTKRLIHTLSLEGRLVVLNLYDDIKSNNPNSKLLSDINRIKLVKSNINNKI